ncbi:choice-of-anchor L domain-containing protein [Flavobacteriaceae bacterium 14752]|uniref:choice-of-anchor L domain-containing protein n=1 Tax=Mesohalobacter salilacus TaxID=2491711 RepID=UPI000F63727E|nr:T9SS C-terminal target domain-containing protein [Flavobacteriaceae bacterium 14752]
MKYLYLAFLSILFIQFSFAQTATSNDSLTLNEVLEFMVEDLDCASISNITSPNNAQMHNQGFSSYGSFQVQNEPNFPFDSGIVLSTTSVSDLENITNNGDSQWPGDSDLAALIQEPGNTHNATVIEFDFIPFREELKVDYLLASDEYPVFVCDFADTFAFIISGPGISNVNPYDHDANPNTPEVNLDLGGLNIATLPGTTIPVNPTNIHDMTTDCTGSMGEFAVPQFFDAQAFDNNIISFTGQTLPLTAKVDLIPGQTYHIELKIADRGDTVLNSAVFIDADSFEMGTIPEDLPYEPGLPVELPECWTTSDTASFDILNTCSETSENYLQLYGGNYSLQTAAVDTDGVAGVNISWDMLNGCNDIAEAGKNLLVEYFNGNDWQLLADIDPISIPVANSNSSDNWMTVNYTVTSGMNKNFTLRFSRQSGNNQQDDISIANLSITEQTLSNEEFSVDTFKIYPNPVSDILTIETLNSTQIDQIEIIDIQGKILKTTNQLEIDVQSLSTGLYFAKISRQNSYIIKRFIKK